MSPRKYEMGKRATALEETRRRIVRATYDLHAEQGIGATTWEEIAARAGVGVGTVYRHFRSLDELLPACGALSFDLLALPDDAEIADRFRRLTSLRSRLERLVSEIYGIYRRGAPAIENARRERHALPPVQAAFEQIEARLAAIVDHALEPFVISAADRALTAALLDVGTWRSLERRGFTDPDAVAAMTEILTQRLAKRTR